MNSSSNDNNNTNETTTTPTTTIPTVQFIVTGFGPFRGVEKNPTTELADELLSLLSQQQQQQQQQQGSDDIINNIRKVIVMEVSVEAVKKTLEDIIIAHENENESMSNHDNNENNNSSSSANGNRTPMMMNTSSTTNTVVLLHLGVNYAGKVIQLEQCAYNDATFRIPDERGYQPKQQCIISHDHDNKHKNKNKNKNKNNWGAKRQTKLNVPEICQQVVLAIGPGVGGATDGNNTDSNAGDTTTTPNNDPPSIIQVSNDPGRFVCNYTYYLSMYQTEEAMRTAMAGRDDDDDDDDSNSKKRQSLSCCSHPSYYSLFVHVPPFHVIEKSKQLQILKEIMKAIETTILCQQQQ